MRRLLVAFLSLALAAGAALAAAPPRTVGDYVSAMETAAAGLDAQLAERQKAGDAAAAQRLVLVAAMIRRAGAEFHAAEQALLTDDASLLPDPVRRRLDAALEATAKAQSEAGDAPGFVEDAHATFNALIDALPIRKPHPVVYGLLSSDLAGAQARLPADIVVYGHRLVDPVYKIDPSVQVAGVDLPGAAVAVHDDRLDVALPAQTKAATHFAPPPCESRSGLALRVHDVYAETHGPWPLQWRTEVETNADLYVLASPTIYEARIAADSQTFEVGAQTVEFRRRSDLAVADCERTRAAEVALTLPEGASGVVCKAAWTGVTGQAGATADCAQDGASVRGAGSLSGASRVCSPDKVCSCPASAQGFLEISGSYRIATTTSGVKPVVGLPTLTFPAGGLARGPLSAPVGERLRHVRIEIARRACASVADALDFTLGDGTGAAAVSRSGAFRALYRDGMLNVGATDALASQVVGKP